MTHQWSALLDQRTHRMAMQYHPRVGHLYVPGLRARMPHERGAYVVKTNEHGFRSDVEFEPKAAGRGRVLFFGDSFTDGQGCDNHERYSDLLGREFGFDAYNLAVTGSAPDQQLLYFEEFGKGLGADLIIWGVAVHNIERIKMQYRPSGDRITGRTILVPKPYFTIESDELCLHNVPVPRVRPELRPGDEAAFRDEPSNPLLHARSRMPRLYGALRRTFNRSLPNLKHYLRSMAYRVGGVQLYDDYVEPDRGAWPLLAAIIRRLADVANVPVLVVPLPTFHYFVDKVRPVYDPLFASLADPARGLHVLPITDALVEGRPLPARRRLCFEYDSHYSPEGHAAVADLIGTRLKEADLLPRRTHGVRAPNPISAVASSDTVMGVSWSHRGSAAALVQDGRLVAAAPEEVFTGRLHQGGFPRFAVNYCLEDSGMPTSALDAIVTAHVSSSALAADVSQALAAGDEPAWVGLADAWLRAEISSEVLSGVGVGGEGRMLTASYGACQLAAAFHSCPFEEAVVMSVHDAVDGTVASIGIGNRDGIRLTHVLHGTCSLQDVARSLAHLLGLPGVAPWHELSKNADDGEGRFVGAIRKLLALEDDGAFGLPGSTPEAIWAALSRETGADLGSPPVRADVARSFVTVIEEILGSILRYARSTSGIGSVCVVGEPFLSFAVGGGIETRENFRKSWYHRTGGHINAAFGGALLARTAAARTPTSDATDLWATGPGYTMHEVTAFLETYDFPYRILAHDQRWKSIAELLRAGKVLGVFDGRIDWTGESPSRWIVADSQDHAAVDRVARMAGGAPMTVHTPRDSDGNEGCIPILGDVTILSAPLQVPGEPIALTPFDAYRCMMVSEIDALVLGEALVLRADQPEWRGGRSGSGTGDEGISLVKPEARALARRWMKRTFSDTTAGTRPRWRSVEKSANLIFETPGARDGVVAGWSDETGNGDGNAWSPSLRQVAARVWEDVSRARSRR